MKNIARIITSVALLYSAHLSAAEIDLKIGTGWNEKFPMKAMLLDVFAPKIAEYSEGRLSADVHMGGSLCSEKTCVEQVKLGQIDIATASVANYGGFHSTLEVLNLPYIFTDDAAAQSALDEFLFDELNQKSITNDNMRILAIVPFLGFRQLETNVGEIKSPSDLRGVKIRVTTSPLDSALLRAWGAVSTPVAWSETYDAIQQKVVRGIYIQKPVHAMMKFHEVTEFVTLTNGVWTPMMIFMDQGRYESLPEWARGAVDKAASDLRAESFAVDQKYSSEIGSENLDKVNYYQPTDDEMAAWRNASVKAWLIAKQLKLYDPELAQKILDSQSGIDDFKEQLKQAGAL